MVLRKDTLPGVRCAIMAPVPGASNRFVFALPQPDETFYVGLTDEEVDEIPDVPVPPEEDIEFLLRRAQHARCARTYAATRSIGAYAGLRPLLDSGTTTADISRKHAVLVSTTGVVTVVGGKLTTYRRMAQDAVDRAVSDVRSDRRAVPHRGSCRCSAPGRPPSSPPSRRPSGWCAASGWRRRPCSRMRCEATGLPEEELLAPIAPGLHATLAELVFAVTHEGAATVEDLLDRRTRDRPGARGPRARRAGRREGARPARSDAEKG